MPAETWFSPSEEATCTGADGQHSEHLGCAGGHMNFRDRPLQYFLLHFKQCCQKLRKFHEEDPGLLFHQIRLLPGFWTESNSASENNQDYLIL